MRRLLIAAMLCAGTTALADKKPPRSARVEYVKTLHDGFVRGDSPLDFALGDPDTSLLVVGRCSEKLLAKVKELTGANARRVGFEQLWCKDGSAEVDL